MKKWIALLTTLTLLLCCFGAMAEDAPFEGTYVPFEDFGMQICLPNDWNVMEVPDDAAEQGIFFVAASPDGARTVQLSYVELDEPMEGIDALVADLSTTYADVKPVQINGIDFAAFTIPDNDICALYCLGGEGVGLYGFHFTPASDAEFLPMAEAIAGSICAIEE